MNKKLAAALVAACTFVSCSSYAGNDSIFWIASNQNQVIAILGVTHDGFDSQYPVRADILQSLSQASVFVTESSLVYAQENSLKAELKEKYTPDSYGTLEALLRNPACPLPERTFARQAATVFDASILARIRTLSPRALVHQLFQRSSPIDAGLALQLHLAVPLEFFLAQKAEQAGQQRAGLDPEYWESFDQMSTEEKCDLISMLLTTTSVDASVRIAKAKTQEALWLQGTSVDIEKENFANDDRLSAAQNRANRHWFELRNQNMVRRLLARREANIFVAIGAAHLAGRHGVLELLRQRGYVAAPQH